ncbi:putative methyltransferase [bacterium MnTg03]|nr:putative methyltransferase [bacterium MnTg03]
MGKPTERFSDRVSNYVRYRPSYPQALVDTLMTECHLDSQSTIADVGSGTGIFSRLLLDKDCYVSGVEPNRNMREAAERQLAVYHKFSSIDGHSESTGLDESSINLITAAQSFHWFETVDTQQEFLRILKPGGYVALIWNQRKIEQPFQIEYDCMLRQYASDYSAVNHMNISPEDILDFFSPNKVAKFEFDNSQIFDLSGFLGRMQSSSYVPKTGTAEHLRLIQAAEDLFNRYQSSGTISFEYNSVFYLAEFSDQ